MFSEACKSDHSNSNQKISETNSFAIAPGAENHADKMDLVSNSKTIDGINFSVNRISPEDVKKIFKGRFNEDNDYSDFTCLIMDITIDNERDIANYKSTLYQNLNERIQYLNFMIKDFISVSADGKKYDCLNSTFDRSYGQLPYSRFFLVFNKISDSEILFQLNDNYFNKGLVNLKL